MFVICLWDKSRAVGLPPTISGLLVGPSWPTVLPSHGRQIHVSKNNSDRFCFLCKNPPVASHPEWDPGSLAVACTACLSAQSFFSCSSHIFLPSGPASPSLPAVSQKLQPCSHFWTCVLLSLNHQLSNFTQLSSHVTVSDHSVCSNTVLLFSK